MSKKFCVGCQTTKDITNFHKDKSKSDGFFPYCKDCRKRIKNKEPVIRAHELAYSRSEKQCPRCKDTKSLDDFHKDKSRTDGHGGICKSCLKTKPSEKTLQELELAKSGKKKCTQCNRILTFDSYTKHPTGKFGLNSHCKNCVREYSTSEKVRKRKRAWNKAYLESHPRKSSIYSSRYREKHPEKVKAYVDQYWMTDQAKELHKIQERKRRTWKKSLPATLTKEQWEAVCNHYGNKCLSCGSTDMPLHIDHIIPVSKGGGLTIDNVQPLCKSCNSRKNDKHIDYRPDRGNLWV